MPTSRKKEDQKNLLRNRPRGLGTTCGASPVPLFDTAARRAQSADVSTRRGLTGDAVDGLLGAATRPGAATARLAAERSPPHRAAAYLAVHEAVPAPVGNRVGPAWAEEADLAARLPAAAGRWGARLD